MHVIQQIDEQSYNCFNIFDSSVIFLMRIDTFYVSLLFLVRINFLRVLHNVQSAFTVVFKVYRCVIMHKLSRYFKVYLN